ncbi:MAG: pyridoxal phosphate-dependent aminotransferase [Rickettsiales bacterium]|jgi:aspartate aminotransferase|nr:pyridoxal phosphate-dependent aminotransferase [Rickettsiales bacterium]
MSISSYVKKTIEKGSVFDEVVFIANQLKEKYGKDKVCDFSIGNPDLPSPIEFKEGIQKALDAPDLNFKYVPFAGLPEVRKKVAEVISKQQETQIPIENVLLTCGAETGLNVVVRAFLEQGDEVIINTPYFPCYADIIEIHGGVPVIVNGDSNLDLSIENIEKALTLKTKLIILNSPNNPSGKIYPESTLKKLADLLKKKNSDAVILSDEPYRDISFGKKVPSVFKIFDNCIWVSSVSKNMSAPAARIGFIITNPKMKNLDEINKGIFFVNMLLITEAPVLEQKGLLNSFGLTSDLSKYKVKMDKVVAILRKIGYEVNDPEGTFYLFPKTPITDDVKFCKEYLAKYNVICTPGTPFGTSGYMRVSCCCDDATIERCVEGFEKAYKDAKI